MQNGIDISLQRSRKFVENDFVAYDKIYVMANDVLTDVKKIAADKFNFGKVDFFMNELYPNKNMDVPDPWYGAEDGYVKVYDIINKACDAIIENYKASSKK